VAAVGVVHEKPDSAELQRLGIAERSRIDAKLVTNQERITAGSS